MSTTVSGHADWAVCFRQACYLSKYIYKEPAPTTGFTTQYPEYMAEIERRWQVWDGMEVMEQGASGLVARLFKLKAWDPATSSALCPPTLAFRGTDFDDLRGMGFSASVRISWGVWWTFHFDKVFDNTIPQPTVTRGRPRRPRPRPFTREDMLRLGFTPINILTETGQTIIESATPGSNMTLGLRINADLMAKEDGDWVNNIYQGLGRASPQYVNAIEFGRRCVDEKIMPVEDKCLNITGHSLGGGLAAAVNCVLTSEFPEVRIQAVTFNAAGVHPLTVAPAATNDGMTHNFTVEDEILTMLQSFPGRLPFIGAIFTHASRSLGMRAMPPALGTLSVIRGRSSGERPAAGHGPYLGAKGAVLPDLFPVANQTVNPEGPSNMPILSALDSMLAASPSVSAFGTRFARWLNARYRETVMREDRPWTIKGIYEGMVNRMIAEMEPEIDLLIELMMHSVAYHGMDNVIATYEGRHGRPR